MTRQLPRLILAVSIAAMSAALARAQAAPAKNPCANASKLDTRAAILEAVPDGHDWELALFQSGIHKSETGEWMQYLGNGEMTARYGDFAKALERYCAARASAAVAAQTKAAAKTALPPEAVRARSDEDAARMTLTQARVLKVSATSDAALPSAPEAPATDPCPSLCESVGSCREAGMGGEAGGINFPCRKAFRDAAAAKCSCS